jgi:hypothetical protein
MVDYNDPEAIAAQENMLRYYKEEQEQKLSSRSTQQSNSNGQMVLNNSFSSSRASRSHRGSMISNSENHEPLLADGEI